MNLQTLIGNTGRTEARCSTGEQCHAANALTRVADGRRSTTIITQLSTVKSGLGILDATYDELLTAAEAHPTASPTVSYR